MQFPFEYLGIDSFNLFSSINLNFPFNFSAWFCGILTADTLGFPWFLLLLFYNNDGELLSIDGALLFSTVIILCSNLSRRVKIISNGLFTSGTIGWGNCNCWAACVWK